MPTENRPTRCSAFHEHNRPEFIHCRFLVCEKKGGRSFLESTGLWITSERFQKGMPYEQFFSNRAKLATISPESPGLDESSTSGGCPGPRRTPASTAAMPSMRRWADTGSYANRCQSPSEPTPNRHRAPAPAHSGLGCWPVAAYREIEMRKQTCIGGHREKTSQTMYWSGLLFLGKLRCSQQHKVI